MQVHSGKNAHDDGMQRVQKKYICEEFRGIPKVEMSNFRRAVARALHFVSLVIILGK